jgi:cyclopropane fatty-acyl-phospholipid synthase-like methyltransferase
MERELFEKMYQEQAPWDIPGPQPEIVRLEEAGAIKGSVLDVGCGTGEHALYLSARGHEVWGIDFVPMAIERAQEKAKSRGLKPHFEVRSVLELDKLGRTFDTVIDSGLLHTLSDEDRALFIKGLANVLRPGGVYHMLCFSDREPGTEGPRRLSQQEIRDAFRDGWEVRELRELQFQVVPTPDTARFSPGGPWGWRATIVRA